MVGCELVYVSDGNYVGFLLSLVVPRGAFFSQRGFMTVNLFLTRIDKHRKENFEVANGHIV